MHCNALQLSRRSRRIYGAAALAQQTVRMRAYTQTLSRPPRTEPAYMSIHHSADRWPPSASGRMSLRNGTLLRDGTDPVGRTAPFSETAPPLSAAPPSYKRATSRPRSSLRLAACCPTPCAKFTERAAATRVRFQRRPSKRHVQTARRALASTVGEPHWYCQKPTFVQPCDFDADKISDPSLLVMSL